MSPGPGLVALVPSTARAVWARLSLGTMWSFAPTVQGDRRLRTPGPYAVTRHPIRAALLGLLLGTTLTSGLFALCRRDAAGSSSATVGSLR